MKSFITILMIAINSVFANAQDFKPAIDELLDYAKTDFKSITGDKKSEENGMAVYTCTHKSDLGKLGDIIKDTKTGGIYYSMYLNYNDVVEDFIKSLNTYINQKFPSPEYYVIGDEDDDYEELSVYSHITDPTKEEKQYLAYFVDINPDTKKKTFELIIYGASSQKFSSKK